MSTESDELRAWRQAFAAPGPPPAPEDCPPPEKIWAALRGELAADEIRDVVDHTALCASCAEDWRLAAALLAEDRVEAPAVEERALAAPAAVPQRRRFFGRQVRFAASLAAAAVVLIAIGIQQRGSDPPEPPVHRGGSEIHGTQPSLSLLVKDGATLPRGQFRLRWSDAGKGASYRLWVGTEEDFQSSGAVARVTKLARPEYLVPPAKLAHLRAGTQLLWQVEARLPDGSSLRSDTFTVELR